VSPATCLSKETPSWGGVREGNIFVVMKRVRRNNLRGGF